jgi:hypothetical protein
MHQVVHQELDLKVIVHGLVEQIVLQEHVLEQQQRLILIQHVQNGSLTVSLMEQDVFLLQLANPPSKILVVKEQQIAHGNQFVHQMKDATHLNLCQFVQQIKEESLIIISTHTRLMELL